LRRLKRDQARLQLHQLLQLLHHSRLQPLQRQRPLRPLLKTLTCLYRQPSAVWFSNSASIPRKSKAPARTGG
jgi:hypothetical protein